MSGIYLYAIVHAAEQFEVGRLGLPDGSAPVSVLPEGCLAAVTSEYQGPALTNLPKQELLRYLAVHQRVIERAMAERRVLPATFGTLLTSHSAVRAALRCFRDRLCSTFERLGDIVEIEVAATWDLGRTFAEIGREPKIAALASSLGRAADQTEAENVSLRIEIGKLVKEALDRRRLEFRDNVMRALAQLAVDIQPNPLLVDEMVVNVAFLVERSRCEEFYAQVHRLDQSLENRLNFRCVGPLPPYSFATVSLIQRCWDDVDAARRLLQLRERVSQVEINTAYRQLASLCHPDRNPGDSSAVERFTGLANAHAILLNYLRGRDNGSQPDDPTRPYDLSAAAVGEVPLLLIRRSGPESLRSVEPSREREAIPI